MAPRNPGMSTQIDAPVSRRGLLTGAAFVAVAVAVPGLALAADPYAASPFRKINDGEWKVRLPPKSYDVLRHEGTEPPGSDGVMLNEHRKGTFACLGCGLPIFKSEWKYDSGTGWPSFYTYIPGALAKKMDLAIGVPRTEYHCAQCLGHQGHVFDDGPKPTGLRYCNNGVALKFIPA
jgi:peptide-methionine (R)-S-oxide reductase